jgi:hypothetical protein
MNYKESRNFLPAKQFLKIKKFFTESEMPWYYNKHQTDKSDASYFSHRLCYNDKIETYDYVWENVIPIINKINPSKLLRVKANLLINRGIGEYCNYHIDSKEEHMVGVYYITTSNGFTSLGHDDKIRVKCEENKLLVFNGKIYHSVVSQTDNDQRIVININFLK